MELTDEQLDALRDGGRTVRLSERQLIEAARETGHEEAAGVVAQKVTAREAVARAVAAEHRKADVITPASAKARIAAGYDDEEDDGGDD